MFPIVNAKFLARDVKQLEIHAPRIARKQLPGQFVILRLHEQGERIPLTIAASDPAAGTITIIVQGVGKTTRLLNRLEAGDPILDVVGPLGKPTDIENFGRVAIIGGGVGTAIALPVARALKAAGNHVIAIVGARTADLLILLDEMRQASNELHIMTDDGSAGDQGFVTTRLEAVMKRQPPLDRVVAIGPIPMMAAVSRTTRPAGIPTIVSLNPIMVDGTGMCGGCRVQVDGRAQFACVDGPEFDAHKVDFTILAQRNSMYHDHERASARKLDASPESELAKVRSACRLEAVCAPGPAECERLEKATAQSVSSACAVDARPGE
ncbi:MAG: sulfide/dihydroorotate dehydrogenase-like FAD/NAD-binding protein [Phycisphaeraceae bacterium]|nr:sulfide/dihydroorotate dehydrogenase-like FAD/NAD-binding protein [Phycisphaeraceae bacterium]